MIAFVDTTARHCMTPVSGSGPRMLVCGRPVMPGRRCCEDCYKVLYVQPTRKALRSINSTAVITGRHQRMTVPETD